MRTSNITMTCSCIKCEKSVIQDIEYFPYDFMCDNCQEWSLSYEDIQELIMDLSEHEPWKFNYVDIVDNQKDYDLFTLGVRHGYKDALFWLAEYFGIEMLKYYEEEVLPLINKRNGKLEEC